MPKFKVWLAADTLLYMPAYALADLGILARVAKAAGLQDAQVTVHASPKRGDKHCIEHMLAEADAETTGGEIHIAICDPVRAFQVDPEGKRISLLGALIKRPPFWEVGRNPPPGAPPEDHVYVYYNENFATGNFLGRRAASNVDEDAREQCKIGEEFPYLDREEHLGQVRVVTADIRTMSERLIRDNSLRILRHFACEDAYAKFISVGVLSHKKYGKERANELALFMEALRSACILLRTAETPTATLVEELMIRERGGGKDALTAKQRAVIAKRITHELFADDIFSDSLSLTHGEWAGALLPRSLDNASRRKASALFFKIYDPRPSRDMTAAWLVKAIKDYGRFASEARRLRGASVWSGLSVAFLACHIGLADYAAGAKLSHWTAALHWSSLFSIFLGTGALSALILALVRDRASQLIPIQRIISIDDETAGMVAFPVISIPTLIVVTTMAAAWLKLPIDWSGICSAIAGFFSMIIWSSFVLWRRRDA